MLKFELGIKPGGVVLPGYFLYKILGSSDFYFKGAFFLNLQIINLEVLCKIIASCIGLGDGHLDVPLDKKGVPC